MVDKIDKPEPPPTYAVTATTETKREKPRDQKGQEDLPTFQKPEDILYREKFQGETGPLKTFQVPMEQIKALLFRRATPHQGAPTTEADLLWMDGKTTEGIHFLLKSWQDFLKIKNLKIGDTIPDAFWRQPKPHLEVTIRQSGTSGSWNLKEMQRQKQPQTVLPDRYPSSGWLRLGMMVGGIEPATKKPNWIVLGLYGGGLLSIIIAIIAIWMGT